jgi:hypothetical protein
MNCAMQDLKYIIHKPQHLLMKKILAVILLIPLLSMKCTKKEGPNCHHKVVFRNHSDFTVLLAELYKNGQGKCRFVYNEFKPGEEIEKYSDNCWEEVVPVNIYILSPENAESMHQDNSYSCDSIGIRNKILKQYVITVDYLREKNWTVNYPE